MLPAIPVTSTGALPTAELCADHQVILGLLDALERLAEEARSGAFRPALAARVVDLLQRFADEAHHAKEERYLFPALEAAGLSRRHGPLAVMLEEHDAGRDDLARMRDAAVAADALGFGATAVVYARTLRRHIDKEETGLFPMSEALIAPDRRAELVQDFRTVERAALGTDGTVREDIARIVERVVGSDRR